MNLPPKWTQEQVEKLRPPPEPEVVRHQTRNTHRGRQQHGYHTNYQCGGRQNNTYRPNYDRREQTTREDKDNKRTRNEAFPQEYEVPLTLTLVEIQAWQAKLKKRKITVSNTTK